MYTRILFVLNDPGALRDLQRQLAPQRTEWEMAFVRSGAEALELMAGEQPYAIVVTALAMPGMSGAALLTELQQRHPGVLRFALATSAETAGARAAVPAHQFLTAPCDLATLRTTVERALALRNCLADERLKALVAQMTVLPSLPDLYLRIMGELRSPDFSLGAIGKIIESDVGMSAKVLTLLNSAYFALPSRVTSPALAVNMLGVDIIKSMVLMSDVFAQFDRIRALAPAFDFVAQQQHSLRVANNARAIARQEHLDLAESDAFFVAGLFHDIGKLTLVANLPQQYNALLERCRAEHLELAAVERETFGATHAEVGAYLLGLWGFPDPIVEACAYHHAPEHAEDPGVNTVTVVHAANAFAHLPVDAPLPEEGEPQHLAWARCCRDREQDALA